MTAAAQHRPVPYGPDTFFVAGAALPAAATPTAAVNSKIILALVCESETGKIIDAECNMGAEMISQYISTLLVGFSIYSDVANMAERLAEKYKGVN